MPFDYKPILAFEDDEKYRPGDIRWHRVYSEQWVKGQKESYASLLEQDEHKGAIWQETAFLSGWGVTESGGTVWIR